MCKQTRVEGEANTITNCSWHIFIMHGTIFIFGAVWCLVIYYSVYLPAAKTRSCYETTVCKVNLTEISPRNCENVCTSIDFFCKSPNIPGNDMSLLSISCLSADICIQYAKSNPIGSDLKCVYNSCDKVANSIQWDFPDESKHFIISIVSWILICLATFTTNFLIQKIFL